jgi:hypothetical protein
MTLRCEAAKREPPSREESPYNGFTQRTSRQKGQLWQENVGEEQISASQPAV